MVKQHKNGSITIQVAPYKTKNVNRRRNQLNDDKFQKELKILMKQHPYKYTKKGIDGVKLIHEYDRVLVPKGSQQHILDWYHKMLCHPGIMRQEQTITIIFTLKNMRKDIKL